MIDGARCYHGGQAGAGELNETIIIYLGKLSMPNYKWFGCCEIADGKVETGNLKVETGRAERVKLAPFAKPTPKGCGTRSISAR